MKFNFLLMFDRSVAGVLKWIRTELTLGLEDPQFHIEKLFDCSNAWFWNLLAKIVYLKINISLRIIIPLSLFSMFIWSNEHVDHHPLDYFGWGIEVNQWKACKGGRRVESGVGVLRKAGEVFKNFLKIKEKFTIFRQNISIFW